MIERNNYLDKLIKSKENGFPKVITGIRRCCKSYLLEEIYKKYLLNNGVNEEKIIIIDLDDEENYDYYDPINLNVLFVNKKCIQFELTWYYNLL